MSTSKALFESTITSLPLLHRGKVRDIYAVGDDKLLVIASDRLSAFDVVLPDPIPDKGSILCGISNFWFARCADLVTNHLTGIPPQEVVAADEVSQVTGRSIVVHKLKALPVEAIVRGYLIGSGWKDYQQTGKVSGIALPEGLEQAQQLPAPIFTPSTKAPSGAHDENISFEQMAETLGSAPLAEKVRDVSIAVYMAAAAYARTKGIIIADTKFEFGLSESGELILIDEILTPDSSRFWPVDEYRTGISPPSFDKQFVRDYLETLDWDKKAPGPKLPEQIINRTADKYAEAYRRLTDEEPPKQ